MPADHIPVRLALRVLAHALINLFIGCRQRHRRALNGCQDRWLTGLIIVFHSGYAVFLLRRNPQTLTLSGYGGEAGGNPTAITRGETWPPLPKGMTSASAGRDVGLSRHPPDLWRAGMRSTGRGCAAVASRGGGLPLPRKDSVMSVTSPPARPPVRPAGTPHRPSSLGYWIGGALIAAACIAAVIWAVLAFFGYTDQVNSFQRMTVPGTATVHLTQPATRVLYYESTGPAPSLAQLGIQVTGPAGTAVTVTSYSGDLRYDVPPVNPTRTGTAIASFDATAPGNYTITAGTATGTSGTIAIGSDLLWDAAPHIIGIIAVFLVGTAAGLTLIIITAVRRSSARRLAAPPR